MVEIFLVIAIWIGHTQRLFAVQRVRTTMDQIVAVSHQIHTHILESAHPPYVLHLNGTMWYTPRLKYVERNA